MSESAAPIVPAAPAIPAPAAPPARRPPVEAPLSADAVDAEAARLTLRLFADAPEGERGRAVLLLDGALLGPSPAIARIPPDGERFLTALPLGEGGAGCSCYGVTRALRFAGGAVCAGAPDVDVYDWGGGVFEAVLHLPALWPGQPRTFPFIVAQLPWELPATRERLLAVLYCDDGLWLSVESSVRVLCGFPLLGTAEGELYTTMRCLVAVSRDGERQEALVLGPDRQERLRVQADQITVTDGCITAIDRLPTQRGHERRTRYRCHGTQWDAEPPETGFFTHDPAPAADAPLAMLEALLAGEAEEALSYLSAELRAGLSAEELTAFLGPFVGVRPFFLPCGGASGDSQEDAVPDVPAGARVLGLLSTPEDGVTRCRRFCFTLAADGSIDNIEEDPHDEGDAPA